MVIIIIIIIIIVVVVVVSNVAGLPHPQRRVKSRFVGSGFEVVGCRHQDVQTQR